MSFSLAASKRRLRPERRRGRLTRRRESDLPFVDAADFDGRNFMLDSCVYVDLLQDRAPPAIHRLLKVGRLNHSVVCLAELTHLLGALDPARAETKAVRAQIEGTINDIPERRLTGPSDRAFGESGLLAGLVMRLTGQGLPRALQNDALLYLQALERGFTLLTRNLGDFDYFDQLIPGRRVLFYRRAE